MCEKCPFNQNKELLNTIFQRINWLEQEIRKLQSSAPLQRSDETGEET